MMKTLLVAALLGLGLPAGTGAALAKPPSYALPDDSAELHPGTGPGFEAAQNNCTACHSADYPNTQPPKRGAAFWQGEVTKMVKVYKAQISDEDQKAIAAYLAETY